MTPKGQRFGSVNGPRSPGIEPYCRNVVSVTLDGTELNLKQCYGASEPEGFVDCYKLRNGQAYIPPGTDDVARERLTGVVEMRLEGEA